MMKHVRKDKSLSKNRGSWAFKSYYFDTKAKNKNATFGIPKSYTMMRTISHHPVPGKFLWLLLHVDIIPFSQLKEHPQSNGGEIPG